MSTESRHHPLRSLCFLAIGACLAGSALAADTLVAGQSMRPNQFLESSDGSHRFHFQGDGNLVLRRTSDSEAIWSSDTQDSGASRLTLQGDGDLVLYTRGNKPLWSSRSEGHSSNRLVVENDGDLAMYSTANKQVWTANTGGVSTLAALTYVGYSQVAGTGSSITINRPSAVQAGDLMVLFTQGGDGQLKDTQTGWTRFARCFERANSDTTCSTTGEDLGLVAYYRFATTSGPNSYGLTKSPSGASNPAGHITATMVVVRGASTSSPIYSYKYLPNDGTGSASVCPSTTGITGGHHICAYAHDDPQEISGFSPLTFRGRILSGGDYVHMASANLSNNNNTAKITSSNVNVLGPGEGKNDLQLAVVIRPAP